MLLLGSVANADPHRWLFGIGAALASVVWFTALGSARAGSGALLARRAWRILDGLIGLTMLAIALASLPHDEIGAGRRHERRPQRLAGYVDVWWSAIADFVAVLEQVPAEQWSTPTDLPGWDVRAVRRPHRPPRGILAGTPEETADVGEPPHVTGPPGPLHRDRGGQPPRPCPRPDHRRDPRGDRDPARRVADDPPTDAAAKPAVVFGGVPWTWEALLRNRPLDVWMHQQDVRRAVGLPGRLDSAAAQHPADYLAESFGFVVAKKAGAPAGTTAVLAVDGQRAARVRGQRRGRGERLPDLPGDPRCR